MDRKKIIIPTACLAATVMSLIVMLANYDSIVINYGIRSFQAARLASIAAVLISAAWTALSVRKVIKNARTETAYGIQDAQEEHQMDEADRKELYQELAEFLNRKWSGMKEAGTLLVQLDSMDEYQDELGRLLEQTKYLKEKPAEIVQQVEDCMYVNIRKLLNYMRIIQTKSPDLMRSKIAECIEKNADLLKKTDDFVVAVVGYVNGDLEPGKDADTKDYVDTYMYVVLQAIKLPETYLK